MRRVNFDMDALRSFCAGIELGSFARAAGRLGRSTSAISMQLKKLEEQAGTSLVRKAGRGLELTPAGEVLLAYARRIVELNDEAWRAVGEMELAGSLRLGLQEDVGERLLADVLGRFARSHPELQVETRIARNRELMAQVESGAIDLAVAWHAGAPLAPTEVLGTYAMEWVGARSARGSRVQEPVRLVMLQAPCLMRSSATEALDRAGIAWRIVYTSASLAGIWAAVAAGLGVTVRTRLGLPMEVAALDPQQSGLPALGAIQLALFNGEATPSPACQRMRAVIRDTLLQRGSQPLPLS